MSQRQVVTTNKVPVPKVALSVAVINDNTVYSAGQVGVDPISGNLVSGIEAQVVQAIHNLEQVLLASGSGLDQVLKTVCYLTDMGDFALFDDAYSRLFPKPYPARSTVQVGLVGNILFEIEAIAVCKEWKL